MTPEFICPVCRHRLLRSEQSLSCNNNHSFDLAREGYVNLLTGKALGPLVGDSSEMVRARQAFLGKGFFEPLAKSIPPSWVNQQPNSILDMGCGEGYYLRVLIQSFVTARKYGIDISKAAISAAAKSTPGASFAVSDINRLIPLPDGSIDAAIGVFSPRNASEFARVIRPGGDLTIVVPGQDHLAAVRNRFGLLSIQAEKAAKVEGQLADFKLREGKTLELALTLSNDDIRNLIKMMPSARHMTPEKWTAVENTDEMSVEARFEMLSFIRK